MSENEFEGWAHLVTDADNEFVQSLACAKEIKDYIEIYGCGTDGDYEGLFVVFKYPQGEVSDRMDPAFLAGIVNIRVARHGKVDVYTDLKVYNRQEPRIVRNYIRQIQNPRSCMFAGHQGGL